MRRIAALAVVLAFGVAASAAAAPSVTIDSGPEDPTPTNDPTPTFGFTAEGGILTECSVDQGSADFGPCDTPSTHTPDPLPDGSWTFRVRVTDLLLDTATATRQFTVDTDAPTVTIDSGPSGPTGDATPTFDFTREAGTTVQCSVDQGTAAFGACTSGTSHTASTLADGNWTFRVRVTDSAGNTAVATRSFTVDTDAPTVTINSGPQDPTPTNDPTPTFGFTAEGGILTECSVDQGPGTQDFGPCDTPSTHTPDTLADGSWIFRVRVTDSGGNTDVATRSFTVDTDAPTVTIDSGPSGPTGDATPTFGFTREAGTTVRCSVDQGTPDFGACSSGNSHTAGTLAEGSWTFRVRVTDTASNSTTQTRGFSVDTTLPSVTINEGPSGPTNNQSPSFGFTREAGTTVECSVDQGTAEFEACTSGTTHNAGQLAEGTWTFRVRVTDPGNNSVVLTQSFTVDVTAPAVTVTGPRRTGQRKPSFAVSSTESGVTFTCALDSNPAVDCGPTFKPARTLKPGRHKLVARAIDAAGNAGAPQTLRFKVLRPALKEGRAKRIVAIALRRHDFAKKVIQQLEETCDRRSRFKFACRFSSTFPGYSLTGSGIVQRKNRLSYRFRVTAQGQKMTLTDENEGRIRP